MRCYELPDVAHNFSSYVLEQKMREFKLRTRSFRIFHGTHPQDSPERLPVTP